MCLFGFEIKSIMVLFYIRMGWIWGDDVIYWIKGLFFLRIFSWDWIIVVNLLVYFLVFRWWWFVLRLEVDLLYDCSSFFNL